MSKRVAGLDIETFDPLLKTSGWKGVCKEYVRRKVYKRLDYRLNF